MDRAIAAETPLSLAEYEGKVIDAGFPLAVVDIPQNIALVSEEISLAEHHLYGSSRLGIQRYDQSVGGTLQPQLSAIRSRWVASSPGTSFYNLSDRKATWWSYAYSDLMEGAYRIVGNDKRDRTGNLGNVTGSGSTDGSGQFTNGSYRNAHRTIGWRQYELSDHLGNVLASVLDRKRGSTAYHTDGSGASVYDYFTADVASAQDYYPFGMLMPGRQFTLAGMDGRFGFNGQQRSDEVYGAGSTISFDARIYDTRVARWWAVDPLKTQYSQTSGQSRRERRVKSMQFYACILGRELPLHRFGCGILVL